MRKIIYLMTIILFGCSNDTLDNTYKWVSLDEHISWSSEVKTCAKQGFKLPTKDDFISKLQQNPNFFDKDTLYLVNPTSSDKIADNKQLSFGQVFSNNDNIYFDIKSKKLIHYSIKLEENNNVEIKTYCITK